MAENWIDFALYALAGCVACLSLFEATRRLAAYGIHQTAVLMFVLSSAACAFAGGFAYQKFRTLSAAAAVEREAMARPAPAGPAKAGLPGKKAQIGQAKQAFKERGALIAYVDRNGETKSFEPTLEDLKDRERIVAYVSQVEFSARASLAEALLWLVATVLAVLMGLIMSFAKPPAPKSPEEAALAAEPPLHG